jgi:hypothetical protein
MRPGVASDLLSGDELQGEGRCDFAVRRRGFSTIDLGDPTKGGCMQQLGAPLAGVNLDPALWSELAMAIRLTGSKDSTVRTA